MYKPRTREQVKKRERTLQSGGGSMLLGAWKCPCGYSAENGLGEGTTQEAVVVFR